MNNHSSNKHLNVFQSYSQKGSLPIENNISRGLAILFQEYPSLLFLFLSKLNQELGKTGSSFSIDYPSDSYCVDFQRHVDSFDSSEMIVGVTLTSEDLPNDGLEQPVGGSGDYITDISINYDNVIIFIEVKRNATDCRNQLALQINKYIDSMFNKSSTDTGC